MFRIAFYVSGHGLGHATRAIELMQTLAAMRPEIEFVVRTSAPRWLFDQVRGVAWAIQELDTDPGIVQIDSLRLDEEATARQAGRFYADFDDKVAAEATVLEEIGADVAIGDVPPLAMAAADRAGIHGITIGNFTWDWIYSIYPSFDRVAPEAIATIARGYSHATCALRLPLHGGFESMHAVTHDIPFIARRSRRDPTDTRRILGVPGDRPVVLASFGGSGVDLPLNRIRETGRFTLLDTPRDPPAGLSYQDLVAAADVVVSKPGYGIVSECVANDTALLYTSRGRFIEYDLFVAEMPRVLRCRYLSQEDLRAGRWADAIEALIAQPAPPERPRIDGASVAAQLIIARVGEWRPLA